MWNVLQIHYGQYQINTKYVHQFTISRSNVTFLVLLHLIFLNIVENDSCYLVDSEGLNR